MSKNGAQSYVTCNLPVSFVGTTSEKVSPELVVEPARAAITSLTLIGCVTTSPSTLTKNSSPVRNSLQSACVILLKTKKVTSNQYT